MSTIAISSLPVVTTGTATDVFPIVQNNVTSQITNANLFGSVPSATIQNLITTGNSLVYSPAPAATISAVTTLTNAQILPQIVVTSGTAFTLTMPLGTTLETLVNWPGTNLGFDFSVINTASGTITMAVNTGVTNVGTLTILTGISARFRIRRTAANTFVMYRI